MCQNIHYKCKQFTDNIRFFSEYFISFNFYSQLIYSVLIKIDKILTHEILSIALIKFVNELVLINLACLVYWSKLIGSPIQDTHGNCFNIFAVKIYLPGNGKTLQSYIFRIFTMLNFPNYVCIFPSVI